MEPLMESRLTARMPHVGRGCPYARLHLRRHVWWLLCVEEAHRRGLVRTHGLTCRREVSTKELRRLQLAVVLLANSRQDRCGYSGSLSSALAWAASNLVSSRVSGCLTTVVRWCRWLNRMAVLSRGE